MSISKIKLSLNVTNFLQDESRLGTRLAMLLSLFVFSGSLFAQTNRVLAEENLVIETSQGEPSAPTDEEYADLVLEQPQYRGLDSNLFIQIAAEYRACCLQAYNWADRLVQEKLAERESLEDKDKLKPAAVVLDLDETVFDNSRFQSRMLRGGWKYNETMWNQWEMEDGDGVDPIPGAISFLKKAMEQGIQPVYITNRNASAHQATMEILKRLGIAVPDELLLCASDETGSDKTSRREQVLQDYDVLVWVGDNLRDFSEEFRMGEEGIEGRNATVDHHADKFGSDWVIIPNPAYGEWMKVTGKGLDDLALLREEVPKGSRLASEGSPQPTVSLIDAVDGRFWIGVGIDHGIDRRPNEWELLTKHFNILTPENCMKPQGIQPEEGLFRFAESDRIVDFAKEKGLAVVGHCLVWAKDDRTSEWWMKDGDEPVSYDKLMARLKRHIDTVVARYGDDVQMWDVVNEALADGNDEYLRDSVWSRTTGIDFIVKAFEYARAQAPNAILIYNDYNCHQPNKRDKLVRLVKELKERGAPIDVVGMQDHYELGDIPLNEIQKTLDALRELGVQVAISELDIDVVKRGRWWADGGKYQEELKAFDPYKDECPPEVLDELAKSYADLFQLYLKNKDIINRVSFWNLHDGQSWLNYFPWNRVNYPLLFDRELNEKKAFHSVIEVLSGSSEPERMEF